MKSQEKKNRGMRVKAPVSGPNAYSMCTTDEPPQPPTKPAAQGG